MDDSEPGAKPRRMTRASLRPWYDPAGQRPRG